MKPFVHHKETGDFSKTNPISGTVSVPTRTKEEITNLTKQTQISSDTTNKINNQQELAFQNKPNFTADRLRELILRDRRAPARHLQCSSFQGVSSGHEMLSSFPRFLRKANISNFKFQISNSLPLSLLCVLLLSVSCPPARSAEPATPEEFSQRVLEAARREVANGVRYDAGYYEMPYPGGDVPADVGACTDLVVRAYRAAGIDLQKEVHEDRKADLAAYPKNPSDEKQLNPSLDHRRCRHLEVWFRRHAQAVTTSTDTKSLAEWRPGDVAFFTFTPGKKTPDHVAVVSDKRLPNGIPFVVDQFPPKAGERFHLYNFYIHSHYRWPRPNHGAGTGRTTEKNQEVPLKKKNANQTNQANQTN